MKLTEWYPASVKPVRNGVYAVFTPHNGSNRFSYWDEKGWRLCGFDAEGAAGEKDFTQYIAGSSMIKPGSKWRGLAQNPSKGKK